MKTIKPLRPHRGDGRRRTPLRGMRRNDALIGKVGSVFISTATGGGNETTITSIWHTLAYHGYIIVGLPYSCPQLLDISEVKSGGPYGAATLAAPDGSRQPSDMELAQARFQGHHVAEITRRLHG